MSEIRIGTSGWHYKHWIARFYPERYPASKMLAFYQREFDTVEINNSLPFTTRKRSGNVASFNPGKLRFAVKGSRFLTHMKKLKDPEPGLDCPIHTRFLFLKSESREKIAAFGFPKRQDACWKYQVF